ncbi:MAG: DUF554 domain-containing protein [Bacillota bacterium]|nr:DUF554 domain-containing protein [Bacillota bacterium]
MYAAIVNALAIVLCSILGILFKNKLNPRFTDAILVGLSIVVLILGASYALKTEDILGMIICVSIGTLLGEWMQIEERMESMGNKIRDKFLKSSDASSSFTEGFMSGSLLFCIGSMAIVGSMEAGINGNPTIILSKSVIDGIASISFAMSMGIGVAFSGVSVLLYQGAITLLATVAAPYLPDAVVLEMSAIGGILMIGISINMLKLKKIKVGNMLPAVFLPILYQPVVHLITKLF